MPETVSAVVACPPRVSSALLLSLEQPTAADRDLTRLVNFFDIPCQAVTTREHMDQSQGQYAIVSSADCLADAIEGSLDFGRALPPWISKASTVYVYGFQNSGRSTKLLRFLTGDPQAEVRPINNQEAVMTVTADYPDMCGPMSGMRVPVTLRAPGCVYAGSLGAGAFQSIIRADEGEVFFGVTCAGVRFFLNMWGSTLDIDALAAEYFDVKKFFCEAVPVTFYLKWAFRDAALSRREINACLIVDDPPLKRRYGFLDFREALDLMGRHNFATTIAFIPWNWRRTDQRTVSMFQNNPERLSLVVHGCDHTSGEFAERSAVLLNRKLRTSTQRMERFRRRASLKADRVMVFPQGQFSPETGRALKLNEFDAAVNTEVAPAQGAVNKTTIADLWSLAIMRYGTFPIFTRRYLHHGIENFAFDALLGKPCLIASHHDVFRNHARDLVDMVARLNSLKWNLVWRPLGEVIRRGFTVRPLDDGTRVVRMFASSMMVENTSAEVYNLLLLKEEGDPDCLESVSVNEAPVAFNAEDGYLRVRLTLVPGDAANVRVVYRNNFQEAATRDSSGAKIKIAAKRYLSEFRDNYLSRNDFLYQSATRVKRLMK